MGGRLGNWLSWQRMRPDFYKKLLFAAVGALVLLSFLRVNHHPHFGVDKFHVFWAGFGLGVSVIMIVVLKKIVFPILGKDEDFYDR